MQSSSTSDVRDILEIDAPDNSEFITKDALFNNKNKKPIKKVESTFKKPEGMHRELWGLLWTDSRDPPPLMPTDTHQGYKQMKAKIGQSKVRPWKWMPFTNPARKDGAVFHHWRRVADEGVDYPFARFNKSVDIPTFSDVEYHQHLHDEGWTRAETDHLLELANRFDLRFIAMHDRWDEQQFVKRSVVDLKERYYHISNTLARIRSVPGQELKIRVYDADHERRRKEQLDKLFNRTPEQIEEEEYLISELKKIEQRKKEREKKTQDLQKLITAADSNMEARRSERKATKKKVQQQQKIREANLNPESTSIKFPDFKQSGVSLRSQRMKLPAAVGQKKSKAIEQVLDELGLEHNPMPTEDIVTGFNELRQDIVLLYELKLALANCEYDMQTLRHRFETLAPGKIADIKNLLPAAPTSVGTLGEKAVEESPPKPKKIAETIDVVGPTNPLSPVKKRRAALEQGNILKKLKAKS
ncbi:hypothetical protein CAPTEDRAFT_174434 [Capitella teleta]|uniref:DNA methyltransferase 1-associated protein 1 n=1 Tax=Capitella teleta TaxID=283909 RepID=R7VM09_CAPTE|nr:hypothetical protein CAPTEDRAFT_174434 [Capitella teleta]|eukprot:ELU18095.1 hypothetical protein CAPTEDRAFT_174434 [Capitella teleta]